MRLTTTSAANVAATLLAGVSRTFGACSTCGAVAVLFGTYAECAGCFADALGDWESREACTSEAIADLLTGGRSWDERRHQRWTRALHVFARDVIRAERAMLAAESYAVSSAARQAWIESRPLVLRATDLASRIVDYADGRATDLAAHADGAPFTFEDWHAAPVLVADAEREGWSLFDSDGSAHGSPQIQAIDDGPLPDDADAWRVVCESAERGEPSAMLALAVLAAENVAELERVLGAWSGEDVPVSRARALE